MEYLKPPPGGVEESEAFYALQGEFPEMYRRVFSDPLEPRTVVVVPSMSLDPTELAKIPGVIHYEERMLCLLMLLRMPLTQLIYVTSSPIDPAVIDYYLHLLPGVPGFHARKRLHFVSADDDSLVPLSRKLLSRPDLLTDIRSAIRYPASAHMTCFNTSPLEKTLAVQLGVPLYACDPDLSHFGNKSMGRAMFQEVGLEVAPGFENLRDRSDLVDAIVGLAKENPAAQTGVVKLNEGFSGEGNATIDLTGIDDSDNPKSLVTERLTGDLRFEATGETWSAYEAKIERMGGVVEMFIDGSAKASPSVQMRIDPLRNIRIVSTHDQILSGPHGQVFEGCTFPAGEQYRTYLHDAGLRVGKILEEKGVIGRFGVDFISVRNGSGWRHYAIEINLRKGGTTLPYLMLEFLTDGAYDPDTGVFSTPTGDARSYYATDNLVNGGYRGLTPEEMIDMAVVQGLHYHAASQEGMVFHLLGAVTDHGKIGTVSIAPTVKEARTRHLESVGLLDQAVARRE